MNIASIQIEGLFNRFNHCIEFKNNITIIIGKNGVGKTTCLELLYSLFNGNFAKLCGIPYKKIIVKFNSKNKEKWVVIPKNNCVEISTNKDDTPFVIDIEKLKEINNIGNRYRFTGINGFFDRATDSFVSFEQLPDIIKSRMPISFPIWYTKRVQENNVKIIQAQRLVKYSFINDNRDFLYVDRYGERVNARPPQNNALKNAENLSKQIKDIISKASDIATNLDKTFPARLLGSVKKNNSDNVADLEKRLDDLKKKRNELSSVGLIGTEKETSTPQTQNIDASSVSVLNLYIQDSMDKLKPYEEIMEKLKKLKEIINNRFLYKQIKIDKDRGYFFINEVDEEIPIEKLSSGEQNELVMFYNMLFECNENSLILIDEPEISLHIEWLNNLLQDLMDISKLSHLSMLIATHSPDFIGDKLELQQILK